MQVAHLYTEVTLRLHYGNIFKVTVKDVVDHDFSQGIEARTFPGLVEQ